MYIYTLYILIRFSMGNLKNAPRESSCQVIDARRQIILFLCLRDASPFRLQDHLFRSPLKKLYQLSWNESKWDQDSVQVRLNESECVQRKKTVTPSESKWNQLSPSDSKGIEWVHVRSSGSKWESKWVRSSVFNWDQAHRSQSKWDKVSRQWFQARSNESKWD